MAVTVKSNLDNKERLKAVKERGLSITYRNSPETSKYFNFVSGILEIEFRDSLRRRRMLSCDVY